MAFLDSERATQFAQTIFASIHRPLPYKPGHVLRAPADLAMPQDLTPSFFGCFDWHSAVHMHWSLVRLLRLFPDATFCSEARSRLASSLSQENVASECRFRTRHPGHELPYGVAWLLTLQAELAVTLPKLAETLRPLSELAREHFRSWLASLPCAIRSGEHSQSAFAMAMVLDAARVLEDATLAQEICYRALEFYAKDRAAPIAYEPSAYDFLSPALAEADLMRRVLDFTDFTRFWHGFLPKLKLLPVATADRESGKLSHWDGLNLSRSWMLRGIADALPESDPERKPLLLAAQAHVLAGLEGLKSEHYAGSHWLTSFALYATCSE